MPRYIISRLLQMVPVLFLLTILIFGVMRLKGDPVLQFVPPDATAEEIEAARHAYGFDRPLIEQYISFVANAVRGDFGTSFRYSEPALSLVLERVPATLLLTVVSLFVAWLIALPAGMISALRQNSLIDLGATSISVLGRAMPNYWLGIMLILVFAVQLRWVPVSGTGGWKNLILARSHLGHRRGYHPDAA